MDELNDYTDSDVEDVDTQSSSDLSSDGEDITSSSLLSSTELLAQLSQDQLAKLNDLMSNNSRKRAWMFRLDHAATDPSMLHPVISEVFAFLVAELNRTALKDSVIPPLLAHDALELVEGFNDKDIEFWKAGMRKGGEENNWVDLLMHHALRRSSGPAIVKISANAPFVARVVQSAWKTKYEGSAHEVLLESLNNVELGRPYSNQIPIIQSSGTGKSRLVHELAKFIFTIPMNLREGAADTDLAYPPPDGAIRDYFLSARFSTLLLVEIHFYSFFYALFKGINDVLKTWGQRQWMDPGSLSSEWRDYLERESDVEGLNNRTALYQSVIKAAAQSTKIPKIDDETLSTLGKSLKTASVGSLKTLLQTINTLVQLWGTDQIRLVLYVDEIDPLSMVAVRDAYAMNLYDVLCHCLNAFNPNPFISLFLSTTFNMERLVPRDGKATSARLHVDSSGLQGPFTETVFDCGPRLPVLPHKLTLESSNDIQFMAQFGRPLFWSLLVDTENEDPTEVREQTIRFARTKLLGGDHIDKSYTLVTKAATVAVVDVAVMLSFEPRRLATAVLEGRLVASNMRHVFSIPKHREYMHSGYPSEPVIAEAAAEQMWHWLQKDPNAFVEILRVNLDSGLLDRGKLGEVIGRHLLLEAYMRAVCQDHASINPPDFGRGCSFITFVKEFFVPSIAEQVLNSKPDNLASDIPLREAFKHARLRFTHFGKLADDAGLCTAGMYAAFLRQMASICRNGQPSIDGLLPILLWDDKLCEATMTGLLLQFKRRLWKRSRAIDEEDFSFFPVGSSCEDHDKTADGYVDPANRPYVTWTIELGVQTSIPLDAKIKTKTSKVTKPSTGKRKRTPLPSSIPPAISSHAHIPVSPEVVHHPQTTHPRYSVFINGCSEEIFKGITQQTNTTYAHMLQTRQFLSEHPRQTPLSRAAILRQKPVFAGGIDGYGWIENETLRTMFDAPTEEGYVIGRTESDDGMAGQGQKAQV